MTPRYRLCRDFGPLFRASLPRMSGTLGEQD
jgi:hypothetical protein